MTPYIARTKGYFGQVKTITALKQMFGEIQREAVCCLAYVEAPGGLGKSFLQVKLPDLLDSPNALVSQPIDLSDPETRSGNLLSTHVIESLGYRSLRLNDLSAVTEPFGTYHEAEKNYYADLGRLNAEENERRRADLLDYFVSDLNDLAKSRPIVLCLDTAEALVSSAPEGQLLIILQELNQHQKLEQRRILKNPSTIDEFLEWFDAVMPRLKHVLIVVCGRPIEKIFNYDLKSRLFTTKFYKAQYFKLEPLRHEEIANLLSNEWQGADKPEELDIDQALKVSDGSPLLATIYLEMRRRSNRSDIAAIQDRGQFQRYLLESLLDPLAPRAPFAQEVVAYSLYTLVHARRGLTAEQLKVFLRRYLGILTEEQEHDLVVAVDNLHLDAMVKYREENELLLLHDEIFVILDQSGISDTLDIRGQVQDYLIELAKTQFRATKDRSEYLRTMSNLIFYQIEKDPEKGYIEYLKLMIGLFNTGEYVLSLILRDDLWRWLSQPVSIAGRKKAAHTNRDRLGRGNVRLTIDEIQRDDAVWLVKYYMKRGELEQAVLLGQKIKETIVYAKDQYYNFDLSLALGQAMVRRFDQEVVADESEELLDKAVILAYKAQSSDQFFFQELWAYFHGLACTMAGYRWRTLFDFEQAAQFYERGRDSFRIYALNPKENLDVAEALTQLEINLAYVQGKSGNSARAAQLIRAKITARSFTDLSLGRQALSYNVASIVETERGDIWQAKDYVRKAWDLALRSENKRTIAQVALQVGVTCHEEMKLSNKLDRDAANYFRDAIKYFTEIEEMAFLREAELEYERYLRNCAIISRLLGRDDDMQTYLSDVKSHLDAAFEALSASPVDKQLPTIHRVELLVDRAFMHRLYGEYPAAHDQLADAEKTLRQLRPPPRTALIVASTICYEQGKLAIVANKPSEATNALIAAFAHAQSFSRLDYSIRRFWELINSILPDLETNALQSMFAVAADTQVSQPLLEGVVPKQMWIEIWEESRKQIRNLLDDIIYARL